MRRPRISLGIAALIAAAAVAFAGCGGGKVNTSAPTTTTKTSGPTTTLDPQAAQRAARGVYERLREHAAADSVQRGAAENTEETRRT